jgi:hypothetical protein
MKRAFAKNYLHTYKLRSRFLDNLFPRTGKAARLL